MRTVNPILSLPEARLTPFQNSILNLLAEAAGLPAALMLDMLLMEAVLMQFMSETPADSAPQEVSEQVGGTGKSISVLKSHTL